MIKEKIRTSEYQSEKIRISDNQRTDRTADFCFSVLCLSLSVFCSLILLPAFPALAQGQAGTDLAILNAGVGARALGMGSAFTAIADNADAPYWNPASPPTLTTITSVMFARRWAARSASPGSRSASAVSVRPRQRSISITRCRISASSAIFQTPIFSLTART